MEVKQEGEKWLGRKNKKAKRWEDITDLIHIDDDFMSVMGKAGRTNFHSYLGKSGKRWTEMYGVTSLLGYWGEKDKLVQWAVDKAVDYLETNAVSHAVDVKNFESLLDCEEWRIKDKHFKEARSAHKRSLEESGNHGTDKHAEVEEFINCCIDGIPSAYITEDEQIGEFLAWAIGKTFLASEMPLRSKKLWTAGTTDFICEIDGKRYIGDLKTSNYVSYTQFVQCGAYALMYEEMGLGKIDGILIAHMPRTGGFKVHIDEDVNNFKKDFEAIVRLVKRDKEKSYKLYS